MWNKEIRSLEKLICIYHLIKNFIDPIYSTPLSLMSPKMKIVDAKDDRGNIIEKVVLETMPVIRNLIQQGWGGMSIY